MPAVLEVRSNRHLCMNQCSDHACYAGDNDEQGCPMFRHPFMVDNNRDCIVCGQCMKSCTKQSIQLNVRMAPQELWNIEIPRRADSFLIVSLGQSFSLALHVTILRLATYCTAACRHHCHLSRGGRWPPCCFSHLSPSFRLVTT